MNDMKSSGSSSLKAQIVLWATTLLAPSVWVSGLSIPLLMAPIWSVNFGILESWNLGILESWFMYALPVIVTAAVLSLYIQGFGRPVVTKLTIALGAIIVTLITIVSDYLLYLEYSEGWTFPLQVPLPIALAIQYLIFQSLQKI